MSFYGQVSLELNPKVLPNDMSATIWYGPYYIETSLKDATKTRNRSIYTAAVRNQTGRFLALGFKEAEVGGRAEDLHKYYSDIMQDFGKDRILKITQSICTDAV